jgi:hypothetical protein
MKIRQLGTDLFHADGKRGTFANMPKKEAL